LPCALLFRSFSKLGELPDKDLTATETQSFGYASAYLHGGYRPNASNLNYTAGQTLATW
jgi:hypothetical protein